MEPKLYLETHPPPKEFDEESTGIEDGKAVSLNEYWDSYYVHETRFEWNQGKLEEVPVSDYESMVLYRWFISLLEEYFKVHPGHQAFLFEMGFKLFVPSSADSIRKPDFAVIHKDNPVPMKGKECTYSGIPDICIELLSFSQKSEIERDTISKKAEYEAFGIPIYIILDNRKTPKTKRSLQGWKNETEFYQLNAFGKYEPIPREEGNVVRINTFPDFAFRVKDLEAQTDLIKLVDDPVYKPFVMLDFQNSQKAKEAAELREAQERQAKEAAELREAQEQQAKEQERQAKEAAELREAQERKTKEQERQAKEAAELRESQERQAKEAAELRESQERQAKEAAELRESQERQAKEQAEQEILALKAELERMRIKN